MEKSAPEDKRMTHDLEQNANSASRRWLIGATIHSPR